MLNPFPIQFLALFAYFILRVFVGLLLVYWGARLLHSPQMPAIPGRNYRLLLIGLIEVGLGTLLTLGAFTQYAALGLLALALGLILHRRFAVHSYLPPTSFWVLMCGCALTLFITGAGTFAFDLPI